MRLYDANADSLRGEFKHGGAVLDCCFHDDSSGFSVCADNKVRRCVEFCSPPDFVFGLICEFCF